MGLINWLKKFTQVDMNLNVVNNSYTEYYNLYDSLKHNRRSIYFSEHDTMLIDNSFLDHDGYFTKLINKENKVIGYIFRCTHKNVELVNNQNEKRVIPYLVTCYYQPVLPFTSAKVMKTLGKERALKSGLRATKFYIKGTNDLTLDGVKTILSFSNVFPLNYENMQLDNEFNCEFRNMSEYEYNEVIDYIKNFDDKVYKYYNDIDTKNIVKIWLKN